MGLSGVVAFLFVIEPSAHLTDPGRPGVMAVSVGLVPQHSPPVLDCLNCAPGRAAHPQEPKPRSDRGPILSENTGRMNGARPAVACRALLLVL
jgi:hypothetical protein